MGKKESGRINVEIAPANGRRLDEFIEEYNSRPERTTPKLNYTDVINEALASFFDHKRID